MTYKVELLIATGTGKIEKNRRSIMFSPPAAERARGPHQITHHHVPVGAADRGGSGAERYKHAELRRNGFIRTVGIAAPGAGATGAVRTAAAAHGHEPSG